MLVLATGRKYTRSVTHWVETANGLPGAVPADWDVGKLKALGHFYSRYDNIDHLKRLFRDQLDKLDI